MSWMHGCHGCMLTAVVGGNLSNQSTGTGEWTFVSCKILRTQNELVVWFVNGSPLSSLEAGLFQRSPNIGHSHCNNVSNPEITTHGLSLRFDHQFYIPVNVYCAVISICDITSNNCSPKTCFSDIAYLEGKPCSTQSLLSVCTRLGGYYIRVAYKTFFPEGRNIFIWEESM